MAVLRLTAKQARKYSFTGAQKPEKPAQKPSAPAQESRRSEKSAEPVSCAIGEKYRVQKRMPYDNPPPVGTVCQIWQITDRRIFLIGDGYSMDVNREQLGKYFVREETETC